MFLALFAGAGAFQVPFLVPAARLSPRVVHGRHQRLCMAGSSTPGSSAARLRDLLAKPGIITMPCCFDGLSAKLVQRAGFDLTFMSGFSTSAAKLGLPDTGYMSYGEASRRPAEPTHIAI